MTITKNLRVTSGKTLAYKIKNISSLATHWPWPKRLNISVWISLVFILEHLCLSLILKQRDGVRKLSLRRRGRLERPPWNSDNFVCRRWSFSTGSSWSWSEGIPSQSSWINWLKGGLLRRRRVVLYGNDVCKAINDILLQHQQVLFVLTDRGRRTLCPYIVGIVVVFTIRSLLCNRVPQKNFPLWKLGMANITADNEKSTVIFLDKCRWFIL